MAQLIDKDALVAEIERLKERFIAFHHRDGNDWPLNNYGKMRAYNEVLSFLNSIEVKEVDLENLIDEYTQPISAQDIKEEPFTQLEKCAKHFFELGMAASNKAQKEEKV